MLRSSINQPLGLAELFGNQTRNVDAFGVTPEKHLPTSTRGINAEQWQRRFGECSKKGKGSFFTLRMEHRTGGPLARHRGEERILLFRSDRAGAIAKIIFSSAPPAPVTTSSPAPSICQRVDDKNEYNDADLMRMAQAKIHVLDVKEPYRGFDLGSLLFSEAIASLRRRYDNKTRSKVDSVHNRKRKREHHGEDISLEEEDQVESSLMSSIHCQLDAEEDVRRHNKLVRFYEQLGCRVKPKAKVLYLNNNDGETYRKVPMQIALRPPLPPPSPLPKQFLNLPSFQPSSVVPEDVPTKDEEVEKKTLPPHFSPLSSSLVGKRGFLPVRLFNLERGERFQVGSEQKVQRVDWLVSDDGEGRVQFHTTHGHRLLAGSDGEVIVVPRGTYVDEKYSKDDNQQDGTSFDLWRVSDDDCSIDSFCDELTECPESPVGTPSSSPPLLCPDSSPTSSPHKSKRLTKTQGKDLWILRSSTHGTFLSASSSLTSPQFSSLSCSDTPYFWHAEEEGLSLTCTKDTPSRRKHYCKTWMKQSVEYVRAMKTKYTNCHLGQYSLKEALDGAKDLPCHPFRTVKKPRGDGVSIRTFLFKFADVARREGQPDWVQLVALIHELGRFVNCIDPSMSVGKDGRSCDMYDWTIGIRSRVVGCVVPDLTTFSEFHSLNPDLSVDEYNSPHGIYEHHCGLENVMLTWSGPEYLYNMLRLNDVSLPYEALAMIRLFSLGDWHEHGEYSSLSNEDDENVRCFVSDFDSLRRRARMECEGEELTDEECGCMWEDHFVHIAAKYNCGEKLSW